MKTIHVVAAVIVRCMPNGEKQVLATQRGYGEYKDFWEFPGGKIEKGETPKKALGREIKEELLMDIDVGEEIGIVEYDYPAFHLRMQCFVCSIAFGEPTLLEHENALWLSGGTLLSVNWLPSDKLILPKISELLV